jgi:hypothetical protein
MGAIDTTKWKQTGTYYDMNVEKKGKKRRLVDFSGKIILKYNI